MSYYGDPNDPLRRDTRVDSSLRRTNAGWGWVAGALLLIVLLAIAFGAGYHPNQTGNGDVANNTPPPVTNNMPAPNGPASSNYSPAPLNPMQPQPQPAKP